MNRILLTTLCLLLTLTSFASAQLTTITHVGAGSGGAAASTDLSDSSNLARLNAANVFSADNTFSRINGSYISMSTDPAIANFYFGPSSAQAFTTGHDNLFIGLNAGDNVTTGVGNLGIGHSALGSFIGSVQASDNNIAIGWDSQFVNTTGYNNVTLGVDAFKQLLSGNDNVGIGTLAGHSTTTGYANIAIGTNALYFNLTGFENVAVGWDALDHVLGQRNVGIGSFAGANTVGDRNTIVGAYAGNSSTIGSDNVFLGYAAGYYETASNVLMIDDRARTNEADARIKALIYGTFASTVAAQQLTVNAALNVSGVATFAGANNLFGSGSVTAPSIAFSVSPTIGLYRVDSSTIGFALNGSAPEVRIGQSGGLSFLNLTVTGGTSVLQWAEAGFTLGIRNGTNPMLWRLYNTYTSATNRENVSLGWASNVLTFATEAGSAGGITRSMVAGAGSSVGTNIAGATTTIQAGLGTGTGAPGTIVLRASTAAIGTGTTVQTAATHVTVGNGATAITGKLTASGGFAAGLVTVADATTITCNWDTMGTCDQVNTQATGTLTIAAIGGACVDGQKMTLRITSTNVQTFAWNAVFRFGTDIPSIPSSTGGAKTDYIGLACALAAGTVDVVSVARGY